MIDYPLECLFGIEGNVALDRNPEQGYHTLLLRMMSDDLLNAYPTYNEVIRSVYGDKYIYLHIWYRWKRTFEHNISKICKNPLWEK